MLARLGLPQPTNTSAAASTSGAGDNGCRRRLFMCEFPRSVGRSVLVFVPVLLGPAAGGPFGRPVEHAVAAAVVHRLVGEEPLVAVEVPVDLLGALAGEL